MVISLIHKIRNINQLAPGRCGCKLISVMFQIILGVYALSTCWAIDLSWMPQNAIDDRSTLGKVILEPMLTQISIEK